MKNLITTTVVILLMFFASCSSDTSISEQENNRTNKQIDLLKGEYNIDINFDLTLLLKYNDFDDLDKNIDSKLSFVLDDVRLKLKAESLENITFTLVFSNGEVHINDLNLAKVDSGIGMGNGACPRGATYLGSCSHNDEERDCLSNIISTHLSKELTGVGDCAQVRVSVGLFSTSVCSVPC